MACNVSFIFALILGLLCACVAFVWQAARSDPVRFAFYPGRGVRSKRLRSQQELRILEDFDQRGGDRSAVKLSLVKIIFITIITIMIIATFNITIVVVIIVIIIINY